MEIKFFYNKSESIRVIKDIEEKLTLTGTLRSECSIISPSFTIEADLTDLIDINYCYIEAFNRFYYIVDMVSVRNGLIQITLNCDVLMSFRDAIVANVAIVERQETLWNLYLNDGSFTAQQNHRVQVKKFPNSMEGESYILVLAGTT